MTQTITPAETGNYWEHDHDAPPADSGYTSEQADGAIEFLPPSKVEFQVTDEVSAAWALGKIVDCDRRMSDIDAMAEKMKADIQRERNFLVGRFGAQLEWFAGERLAEINKGRPMAEWKKKSIKLLTGALGFKKKPLKLEVINDAALREWAEENCPAAVKSVVTVTLPTDAHTSKMVALHDALRGLGIDMTAATTTSILKTPINEMFTETGVIPDGVEVRPESQSFSMEGL